MNRRVLITATSLATVLVVALVAAGPVQAKSSKAKEKAEHARIVRYWTPQRMKNAVPRDFVKTGRGFVPAAKGGSGSSKPKGPGGGGGGGTSTVTGASWTATDEGLTETGKVFFTLGSTNYVCSGSTVDDGNRADYSMVLTAGHCAIDELTNKFATNFMYVPAYDESPVNCFSAGACFTATALVVRNEFATAGGFNTQAIQHDWAFAIFSDDANGGALDADGAFGIAFTSPSTGDTRQSFGYPAAGKYSGGDLIYCLGPVAPDGNYDTWGMNCDMTGGASGGPWIEDYGKNSAALNSVNSYKYNGGPLKNYMFGPTFNSKTQKTYEVARSATSNARVSGS